MKLLKWMVNREPVWLASAVMGIVGFVFFVGGKYGFDPEIGAAFMTLLPVLLAPLTRMKTSSTATVEQVAHAAARTGDASTALENAGVKTNAK